MPALRRTSSSYPTFLSIHDQPSLLPDGHILFSGRRRGRVRALAPMDAQSNAGASSQIPAFAFSAACFVITNHITRRRLRKRPKPTQKKLLPQIAIVIHCSKSLYLFSGVGRCSANLLFYRVLLQIVYSIHF